MYASRCSGQAFQVGSGKIAVDQFKFMGGLRDTVGTGLAPRCNDMIIPNIPGVSLSTLDALAANYSISVPLPSPAHATESASHACDRYNRDDACARCACCSAGAKLQVPSFNICLAKVCANDCAINRRPRQQLYNGL